MSHEHTLPNAFLYFLKFAWYNNWIINSFNLINGPRLQLHQTYSNSSGFQMLGRFFQCRGEEEVVMYQGYLSSICNTGPNKEFIWVVASWEIGHGEAPCYLWAGFFLENKQINKSKINVILTNRFSTVFHPFWKSTTNEKTNLRVMWSQ